MEKKKKKKSVTTVLVIIEITIMLHDFPCAH